MEKSSPNQVLQNFIKVLESASPKLKLVIFFLTPWAMLIAALAKYNWLRESFNNLRTYFVSCLYASVSIPSSHPLNRQILSYMVDHGLGENARTLAVATPQSTLKAMGHTMYMDPYDHPYGTGRHSKKRHTNPEDEEREKHSVAYVPEVGQYVFWWKWHRMTFERKEVMQEQTDHRGRVSKVRSMQTLTGNETIVISCPSLFAGTRPIQEFLNHVKSAPAKDSTTTIYRPDGQAWDQGITRPSRKLNAVTLDSKIKDDLVKDVETYLSPATRKYVY